MKNNFNQNSDGGQDNNDNSDPKQTNENPTSGEDVSGLKSALSKERGLAKQYQQELNQLKTAFEGIDPEAARQAMANLEKVREQQEAWNQRETELTNNLTTKFQKQIQAELEKAQGWQQKYEQLQLKVFAHQAFDAAGGRTGGADDGSTYFDSFLANVAPFLKLNDDGTDLDVVDNTGARRFSKAKPSDPMPVTEFFAQYSGHPVYGHFFAAQKDSAGGGMRPGTGKTKANGTVRMIDRSDVNALTQPGVIEALAAGDGSVILS